MFGPLTEPTDSQSVSKLSKQYVIFVVVLGLGLAVLCTILDHIRPLDFGPPGRFGPRVWLYEPPDTGSDYGGDNQIVTSNDAGTKVFDLPVNEVFRSHERLWSPVVSGYWLAYEEQILQGPKQIKALNFETGQEIALDHDGLGQGAPTISGSWIAWTENSPSDDEVGNIYAYDLTNRARVPIAVEEGQIRCCPRVSAQWVIYLQANTPWDSRRDFIELHAHSLATGEDFAIGPVPAPNNASFGRFHALDNDKVAWVRYGPDRTKSLHLFDLTTREDRLLPVEAGYLGDVSLTAKQQLIIINNNGWKIFDWSKPEPTLITVPWLAGLDYLRAAGDYLVGQTTRDIFVTQILP